MKKMLTAILVPVLLSLPLTTAHVSSTGNEEIKRDQLVQKAIKTRSLLGLNSNYDEVARIFESELIDTKQEETLGFPLLPAEELLLAKKISFDEELESIQGILEGKPSINGGITIDEESIIINVTDPSDKEIKSLEKKGGNGINLIVNEVDYTLAQLEGINKELSESFTYLSDLATVSMVGIDAKRNKVIVYLKEDSEKNRSAILSTLEIKDAIEFVEGSVSFND
ncbi:hypothetical protein ACFOQM_08765 [Paenibacillus sp. GCM10012307]|uniref:Uncharacterized protein n=1 Tax=Paenibacillus roseus TaxID=2798579 RepID=A0A934MUS1_9BACL|nr:hypothetical protein [Paenibacillus roseus]MBJ6361377.1 hypothetical protein [Paenibacillus roseus]